MIHPPVDVDFFTPGSDVASAGGTPLLRHRLALGPVQARRRDRRRVSRTSRTAAGRRRRRPGGAARARRRRRRTSSSSARCRAKRLRDLLRGARAFVFAAEEDFGILPVEAQACGHAGDRLRPRRRAARPSSASGTRGRPALFFAEQSPARHRRRRPPLRCRSRRDPTRICVRNAAALRKRSRFAQRVPRRSSRGGWESPPPGAIIAHAAPPFEAPRVALRRGAAAPAIRWRRSRRARRLSRSSSATSRCRSTTCCSCWPARC